MLQPSLYTLVLRRVPSPSPCLSPAFSGGAENETARLRAGADGSVAAGAARALAVLTNQCVQSGEREMRDPHAGIAETTYTPGIKAHYRP